jgi:hypothetical protein
MNWTAFEPLRRRTRVLLLVLALLSQGIQIYLFPAFALDRVIQISSAQQLLRGHGLSTVSAAPEDLSRLRYEPVVGWPPGYALVVAAFLALTNALSWAIALVDLAAAALFFAAWCSITKTCAGMATRGTWLALWAYWIAFGSPLAQLRASDALALGLFFAALATALIGVGAQQHAVGLGLLSGLLMGLCCSVRFAYWPAILAIPVALGVADMRGVKGLRRIALSHVLVGVGAMSAIALYQRWATGHATYLSSYYAGEPPSFSIAVLGKMAPFPLSSLGSEGTFRRALARLVLPDAAVEWTVWVLAAAILWIYLVDLMQDLVPWKNATSSNVPFDGAHIVYHLTGIAVGAVLLGMVCCLSVRTAPATWRQGGWTYVEEVRYLAATFPFFSLALMRSALVRRATLIARYSRLTACCVLALAVAVMGGSRARLMSRSATDSTSNPAHQLDQAARILGNMAPETNPPIFFFVDEWTRSVGMMAGLPVLPARTLLSGTVSSSVPVRAVLVLPNRSPPGDPGRAGDEDADAMRSVDAMRSFAEAHHLKVIASTYDADYFLVSVGTGVQ